MGRHETVFRRDYREPRDDVLRGERGGERSIPRQVSLRRGTCLHELGMYISDVFIFCLIPVVCFILPRAKDI